MSGDGDTYESVKEVSFGASTVQNKIVDVKQRDETDKAAASIQWFSQVQKRNFDF